MTHQPLNFQRIKHLLPALLTLVLMLAAFWVIYQELQHYSAQEVWRSLTTIPRGQIGWAIVLTLLNVLVFTGYDTLASFYIRHPLPYWKTALSGATSIPVSNTIGFALLSGSAIRYRFYAPWGLTALQIAQIIAFCNLSFWLGLFVVGGVLFSAQPIAIPAVLHLPFATTQPIGVLFLSIIAAYVGINLLNRRSLRIRSLVIPHVPMPLCAGQLLVSSLDWTLAATVFYALLPSSANVSYSAFFAIYLLAQFAGVVSNVPGGLGVFETVILLLLSGQVATPLLFGVLIVYRCVYYLLPLSLAIVLLTGYELRQRSSPQKS